MDATLYAGYSALAQAYEDGGLQMQARTNLSQAALIAIQHSRVAQRLDLHRTLGGRFETPPPSELSEAPEVLKASEAPVEATTAPAGPAAAQN